MFRQSRLLLASLTTALVLVVAFIAAFARFGEAPQASAGDADSSGEVANEWLGSLPLAPTDVDDLNISLTIDRTRAPLAEVVEQFRDRVELNPSDHISQTVLASLLLAQAKQDADLDLYAEAERVIDNTLLIAPESVDAQLVKIQAVSARHDFSTAEAITAGILALEPDHELARTALGDAQLALGDRDAASASFRSVAAESTEPGLTSRLSRIAFLRGETRTSVALAIDALRQASSVPLRPSDGAFYWFQLGFVLYEGGDINGASMALERATEIAPDHPGANELLAHVRISQGRDPEALEIFGQLIERGPAADLYGELAKILDRAGEGTAATEQRALGLDLARISADKYPAERRHLVGFLVEVDTAEAVRLAELDFAKRTDVYAYDTLAWALHKNGESAIADTYIQVALDSGLRDADVFFHAGVIAAAIGDDERAEPLLVAAAALNPEVARLIAAG